MWRGYYLVTVLPLYFTLVSLNPSTLETVSLVLPTPLKLLLDTVKPLTWSLDRPLTSSTFGTFVEEQLVSANGPHAGGWLPVWPLYVEVRKTYERVGAPVMLSRLMFCAPPPRWVFDFT